MNSEERHLVLISYSVIAVFTSIGFTAVSVAFLPFVALTTGLMLATAFTPLLVKYPLATIIGEQSNDK